jgi:hypothetical protein
MHEGLYSTYTARTCTKPAGIDSAKKCIRGGNKLIGFKKSHLPIPI